MYVKSNMETYITICKIDSQQEFALWLRKLKQGICINLEGWDGEGDGREVQKGGDIEEQPHVQGKGLRGPRRAEMSYSTLKIRRGSNEEIPLIQGKEQQLCFLEQP